MADDSATTVEVESSCREVAGFSATTAQVGPTCREVAGFSATTAEVKPSCEEVADLPATTRDVAGLRLLYFPHAAAFPWFNSAMLPLHSRNLLAVLLALSVISSCKDPRRKKPQDARGQPTVTDIATRGPEMRARDATSQQAIGDKPKHEAIFLTAVTKTVGALQPEDLPSWSSDDYLEYKEALVLPGRHSIVILDPKTRDVVRFTDPRRVTFSHNMVIIDPLLYVTCRRSDSQRAEICELDLDSNKLRRIYGAKQGLVLKREPTFVPVGKTLWIEMGNAAAAIDTISKRVTLHTVKEAMSHYKPQPLRPQKYSDLDIRPRQYIKLSSMYGSRRYLLTSTSIEVIDNKGRMPRTLVRLDIDDEKFTPSVLLIDKATQKAAVVEPTPCGCHPYSIVLFVDLHKAKILHSKAVNEEDLPAATLEAARYQVEGTRHRLVDSKGKPLVEYDASSNRAVVSGTRSSGKNSDATSSRSDATVGD